MFKPWLRSQRRLDYLIDCKQVLAPVIWTSSGPKWRGQNLTIVISRSALLSPFPLGASTPSHSCPYAALATPVLLVPFRLPSLLLTASLFLFPLPSFLDFFCKAFACLLDSVFGFDCKGVYPCVLMSPPLKICDICIEGRALPS